MPEDTAFEEAYNEYERRAYAHDKYEDTARAMRSKNVGRAMWNAACQFMVLTMEPEKQEEYEVILEDGRGWLQAQERGNEEARQQSRPDDVT